MIGDSPALGPYGPAFAPPSGEVFVVNPWLDWLQSPWFFGLPTWAVLGGGVLVGYVALGGQSSGRRRNPWFAKTRDDVIVGMGASRKSARKAARKLLQRHGHSFTGFAGRGGLTTYHRKSRTR